VSAGTRRGRVIVVIGSAGRRLYLIDWFRDALVRLGLDGEVVATEHDPTSASIGFESGRASCRERVSISVVPGSLKKKI